MFQQEDKITAAWRNGNASDYDWVIRRLQVRPLRWSFPIKAPRVSLFEAKCSIEYLSQSCLLPIMIVLTRSHVGVHVNFRSCTLCNVKPFHR